ncbi:SDR family NAD(P)-dependent oxidoreductase [Paenibacillus eucommiae]|uniref:NAD(P)-dependent dehydrogenase (Short-subunit alcohol dehydrogenase family) n=1 Tax=Paenibacillus eucommiae TaxID=1355755 RepID=A0ABS4IT27_9BACL|nr:SDR family oxidoreductase [Paenibacillus eucommiae]MBP1990717.1 NAD(P)-dependent dehydrogenase (short-subunit alcohol dehydrogenase family) [Paenibacillus eucommiae]
MNISNLQDKVIVITGALGDAGREAITLFLKKGARIAASDIKAIETYPEWETLLQRYGNNRMLYVKADFTDEDQVRDVFERIKQHFGRLDGSYHNVYINPSLSIAEMSAQDWNRSMEGTLTSAFLVCKYAAQLMIASGGGSIVNTSSILGTVPRYNNASYGAGKAGMEQLTRYAAVEFAPYGIRANAIVPGDFKGEELLKTMSAEFFEAMKTTTLIGRNGTPNEINEVAAFLLSDAASYVTGSVYPVTGGLWI